MKFVCKTFEKQVSLWSFCLQDSREASLATNFNSQVSREFQKVILVSTLAVGT
jgi:hypothetical protein